MSEDYNEHEMGDKDGLGCFRGVMVALGIQAVIGIVVCLLVWMR